MRKASSEIDEIILKSLAFEVKNRYQTSMELSVELRNACLNSVVNAQQKKEAGVLLEEALEMGKQFSNLAVAILKMESAFAKDASLIPRYGGLVDRWRKGILM